MKALTTRKVTENIFKEVLNVLSNIVRWSNKDCSENKSLRLYTELAKQGLNIVIAYIVANKAIQNGQEVCMERFPWIVMNRMFEKTINGNIRDDHINEICSMLDGLKAKYSQLVQEKITENAKEFEEKLYINETWIETKIFKIATKIGTLIECRELKIENAEAEVIEALEELKSQTGIQYFEKESEEYKFFCEVSMLRSSIRWIKQFKAKESSVLEHMGETAIIAFLMGMEKYNDEKIATHFFWCGAFHDLPERWTGDMASPIKDAIPGLRKATEDFEDKVMEEYVYEKLPTYPIKEIMMDNPLNGEYKEILKGADYISAVFECYRNIKSGSRDRYFFEAIKRYYEERNKFTPNFRWLLAKIYRSIPKKGYIK